MAIEIISYSRDTGERLGEIEFTLGQIIGTMETGETPDGKYLANDQYEIVDDHTVVFTHSLEYKGQPTSIHQLTLTDEQINQRALIFDLEGPENQRAAIRYKNSS